MPDATPSSFQRALSWHESTGTILYIQVHTGTYSYILLCTSMYWYILVFTSFTFFIPVLTGWGVCRIPSSPCFWLAGNSTPTNSLQSHTSSANTRVLSFPSAVTVQTQPLQMVDSGGSNVYEVNTWLWNFGRGKPRLGGLNVDETSMRKKRVRASGERTKPDVLRRLVGAGGRTRMERDQLEMKCANLLKSVPVCTRTYMYVLVCTWNNLNLRSFEN